jgi:hypothetical protein
MSQIIKSSSGSGGGFGSPTYFQAYLTSPETIEAGSNAFTVVFDTAIVNEGSAYDTSTGIFTAPANGFYGFSTVLFYDNLAGVAANTQALMAYTGSVQSLRLEQIGIGGYSGTNEIILTSSWQMPMSLGDTVKIQPYADGSGNYVIYGTGLSPSVLNTSSTFSGWRIA